MRRRRGERRERRGRGERCGWIEGRGERERREREGGREGRKERKRKKRWGREEEERGESGVERRYWHYKVLLVYKV